MDRRAQIEHLLEHVDHPRSRWKMDRPDVAAPGGNPGCGDLVTIYVHFEESPEDPRQRRLDEVSFVGSGCAVSQAAASMLMESLVERQPTVQDILGISADEVIEELGRDIVSHRPRCATLALSTLKAAALRYLRDQQRRATGLLYLDPSTACEPDALEG